MYLSTFVGHSYLTKSRSFLEYWFQPGIVRNTKYVHRHQNSEEKRLVEDAISLRNQDKQL